VGQLPRVARIAEPTVTSHDPHGRLPPIEAGKCRFEPVSRAGVRRDSRLQCIPSPEWDPRFVSSNLLLRAYRGGGYGADRRERNAK
jgi:hypothetical protein